MNDNQRVCSRKIVLCSETVVPKKSNVFQITDLLNYESLEGELLLSFTDLNFALEVAYLVSSLGFQNKISIYIDPKS